MFRDLSEAHADNIGRYLQAAAVFGNRCFMLITRNAWAVFAEVLRNCLLPFLKMIL
jgi:hypothetical protein